MRVRTTAVLVLLLGSVLPLLGGTAASAATATTATTAATVSRAGMVATEHDGPHIVGVLTDTTDRQSPQPVAGVELTASSEDGSFTSEATSDDQGRFSLEVPGNGVYTVEIDPETLPEGTFLRNEEDVSREVRVLGFDARVAFQIGPDTRETTSTLALAATYAVNGLIFGIILALGALGLNLVFGTTGLTNFAHGELVTFGALATYVINVHGNLPLWLAIMGAVVVAGVFGWLQDKGFWSPLRRRGTGLIAMMIVSIGMSIFLRYLYQYFFGGGSFGYEGYGGSPPLSLGPVRVDRVDVYSAVIGLVVLAAVAVALTRTRLGKATRAVADNPALAASSGINVDRVVTVVWISGTALAGLSGALLGIWQQVDFQMGFRILLLIFTAVTLGGLGSAWGAMIGALLVGIFIEVSALVVPAELKNTGALAILILILLVRPQGILGRAQRVG